MARSFRLRRSSGEVHFTADLDRDERRLLVDLMRQVVALLDPPPVDPRGSDDPFGSIVAELQGLGDDVLRGSERARSGNAEHDPALARLLPSGNRADDESAAEFRRLTEGSLRARKAGHLRASIEALRQGDRVALDQAGAAAFSAALTDVRLVLAERVGIVSEEDHDRLTEKAELDGDEVLGFLLSVYDFLAWLQEGLTLAMLRQVNS